MPKFKKRKNKQEETHEEKPKSSLSSLIPDEDDLIRKTRTDAFVGATNCTDAISQLRKRVQKSGVSNAMVGERSAKDVLSGRK